VHVLVALYLHLSQATPRSLIEAPTPHCLRCPVEPCTLRYQRRYGAPQIREVLLYQEKGCRTCGSAICSIKSETSLKARELHGKSYVSEPKCVMRCENTGRITCVISERDVVASGLAR
jgi:hypothetical protein